MEVREGVTGKATLEPRSEGIGVNKAQMEQHVQRPCDENSRVQLELSEKVDARGKKDQTTEDPVGLTKSLVWATIERFQQVADQLMV